MKNISSITYCIAMVLLSIVLFCAGYISRDIKFTNEQINNNKPFKNGQILYPDYACSDTLIIVDADRLNKAFEIGNLGTDSEIDSVLHLYTSLYNGCRFEGAECPNVQYYLKDYQIELHNDTIKIFDGDRLVGTHIDKNYLHGVFFDSLILADNL